MKPSTALKAEAIRVIPGVLAAQEREDKPAVAALLRGYWQTSLSLDVGPAEAWACLWYGTLHWVVKLADRVSELEECKVEELAQAMAAEAASWMSEAHGVGGF